MQEIFRTGTKEPNLHAPTTNPNAGDQTPCIATLKRQSLGRRIRRLLVNTALIAFLHNVRRYPDLPWWELLDLALNIELRICPVRWHSSMSMNTFHVLYEAWCLPHRWISLEEQVRQSFLDEWLEGWYARANEPDIGLDA